MLAGKLVGKPVVVLVREARECLKRSMPREEREGVKGREGGLNTLRQHNGSLFLEILRLCHWGLEREKGGINADCDSYVRDWTTC